MEPTIHCKFDEMVEPKKLKDHPKNRNKHGQDQIDRLAELYSAHGIRHPIIVSKNTGYIVAGHGRKLAAIRAGIKKMPVVFQEFENDEMEYAFIQSDNAIALWADLDLSAINVDLQELGPDFNIDWLGIKGFTLDMSEKEGLTDPDELPEQVEPVCKLGEIWQLGNHRLMCGDSTKIEDVEKLMAGEKADMVFTDPPYGMNLDTDYSKMPVYSDGTKPKKYKKVIGDDSDFDPLFILSFFNYVEEIFLWGFDYYAYRLPAGVPIVWDKRVTEDFDKRFGSAFELCWSKAKHRREIARIRWTGLFGTEQEHDHKRSHPTQKPVLLVEWFFERFKGNNVVDLYGGSGSTLIACEKTNRKCFMMELDPHYCDVIIQRWENFTGQKAEKLDG